MADQEQEKVIDAQGRVRPGAVGPQDTSEDPDAVERGIEEGTQADSELGRTGIDRGAGSGADAGTAGGLRGAEREHMLGGGVGALGGGDQPADARPPSGIDPRVSSGTGPGAPSSARGAGLGGTGASTVPTQPDRPVTEGMGGASEADTYQLGIAGQPGAADAEGSMTPDNAKELLGGDLGGVGPMGGVQETTEEADEEAGEPVDTGRP